MREIKFTYIFEHIPSSKIETRVFKLCDIEVNGIPNIFLTNDYKILNRRLLR